MKTTDFIKYLQGKNLSQSTINQYTKYAEKFFKWVKAQAEQVTKPDVLRYLEYLKNTKKLGNKSRSLHLRGISNYFTFLLKTEQITSNPCSFLKIRGTKRKTLYKIYTPEELDTLLDSYYQVFVRGHNYRGKSKSIRELTALCRERNALILSFLIYQKTTLGEMEKIETGDIDFIKGTVKIRGASRANDRILPLKASQIGMLMLYLQNIRPQFAEYQINETEKLFLSLPQNKTKKQAKSGTLADIFSVIAEQLKTIDKQFLNFKQIRASTVSFWIKTQGLRKAQYLAGHRYISSTGIYKSIIINILIQKYLLLFCYFFYRIIIEYMFFVFYSDLFLWYS